MNNIEAIETHRGWTNARSLFYRSNVVEANMPSDIIDMIRFLIHEERFEVTFDSNYNKYCFQSIDDERKATCPKYAVSMSIINESIVLDYALQCSVINKANAMMLGLRGKITHPYNQLGNIPKFQHITGKIQMSAEIIAFMNTKTEQIAAETPLVLREFMHFLNRNGNNCKYVIVRDAGGFIVELLSNTDVMFYIANDDKYTTVRWLLNQLFVPFDLTEEGRKGDDVKMGNKISNNAEPPKKPKEHKCECSGHCRDNSTEIMAALRTISNVCKEHSGKCSSSCPLAIQAHQNKWECGVQNISPERYQIHSPQEWRALG